DLSLVQGNVLQLLPPVSQGIPKVINGEDDAHREDPRAEKAQGVPKVHASKIAKEERWIPQWRQATAYVRDEKDEEDDRVNLLLPLGVGSKQGSNQEHACAGRPDEARQNRARPKERAIHGGRRRNVSTEENAPRDRVEAEEKDDEWHVIDKDGVLKDLAHRGNAVQESPLLVGIPNRVDERIEGEGRQREKEGDDELV